MTIMNGSQIEKYNNQEINTEVKAAVENLTPSISFEREEIANTPLKSDMPVEPISQAQDIDVELQPKAQTIPSVGYLPVKDSGDTKIEILTDKMKNLPIND